MARAIIRDKNSTIVRFETNFYDSFFWDSCLSITRKGAHLHCYLCFVLIAKIELYR